MTWRVELGRTAERELAVLPDDLLKRITQKLERLAEDPFPRGVKKLQGGGFRIRVGDYRVLYHVSRSDRRIAVFAVGHRREVYRR